MTAACSVMLTGPALSAFAIFHWSECADVVNVPGGNGAVAEERSVDTGVEDIAANPIATMRAVLNIGTSLHPGDCTSGTKSRCAHSFGEMAYGDGMYVSCATV